MGDFLPFTPATECNGIQLSLVTCIYGYVLFTAAGMIGDGSELLLLVPAYADLVGSVVLPILGAVPDGMMILCSGLGPRLAAQNQVSVGVGALAGSTIMLLTLAWYAGVYAGRVNILPNGLPNYKGYPKLDPPTNKSLMNTGVRVGPKIKKNAIIMMVTSMLYMIVQIPALGVPGPEQLAEEAAKMKMTVFDYEASYVNKQALIGLCVCILSFCVYLYLQTLPDKANEEVKQRLLVDIRMDAIRRGEITLRGVMFGVVSANKFNNESAPPGRREALDNLLPITQGDMAEMRHVCKPFFEFYDMDRNNRLSRLEFSKVMCDLRESIPIEYEEELFRAADLDNSGYIDCEEFIELMIRFCRGETVCGNVKDSLTVMQSADISGVQQGLGVSLSPVAPSASRAAGSRSISNSRSVSKQKSSSGEEEDEEEDEIPDDLKTMSPEEQQQAIKLRSLQMMGMGTILVLVFSDPMVEVLNEIGTRTGVPNFYISFILAPLASNASELVAATQYGAKKTQTSMSISLATLLGAACMNNTFCLAIFYMLIYFQSLVWSFTAEILVIVLVQLLVGCVAMKQTQRLGDATFIFSLYPLSLIFVWFLNNIMQIP